VATAAPGGRATPSSWDAGLGGGGAVGKGLGNRDTPASPASDGSPAFCLPLPSAARSAAMPMAAARASLGPAPQPQRRPGPR